jgi:hypothetical protein
MMNLFRSESKPAVEEIAQLRIEAARRCRSSLESTSWRSPRSARSCRHQLRNVCSEQPNSAASCLGVRIPALSIRTASTRNSGGYGGLVFGTSAPLTGR